MDWFVFLKEVRMESFNIDALAEQCQEDTQLFGIMFVLLSKCNHNCIHCYIPEHSSDGLSSEVICRLIDEARELGALNVTFTGGEILLRPDLIDLVRYARSKFMRVFLMSNGYALTEGIIKELAALHISEFSTTIYAMDPIVHDKITGVPGSFHKTMCNVALLKKRGIDVTVKTPLMEYNKFSYRDVESFARKNGFSFRTTPTIFSRTNGDRTPHHFEIRDNLRQIVHETDRINKQYRGELVVQNNGEIPCSAGHSSICINYDGIAWPCNTLTLDVGNILKQSLRDIWINSEPLNEWRRKCRKIPHKCADCYLYSRCVRCPGLAYMEDDDLYGCSSSAKKIAEQRSI